MKTVLNPKVLKWARTRAGLDHIELARRIYGSRKADPGAVERWEETGELTYHQVERLAESTHTPFGSLFLDAPPKEELPITDFRTVGGSSIRRPSTDLLDVIYQCQLRQGWYRDYQMQHGEPQRAFVGRATTNDGVIDVAKNIRATLQIGPSISTSCDTWEESLHLHYRAVQDAGILLMRSSMVGNNYTRKLNVKEFRGFALSDPYAPLVFLNTNDAKAALLFTLAHEIAHIWIGDSSVSNPSKTYAGGEPAERFCNAVAAEVLVPMADFKKSWDRSNGSENEILKISRRYKVSSLVSLRRARDADLISQVTFDQLFALHIASYIKRQQREKSREAREGGDVFNNIRARASERFCKALISSTLEGTTAYREAFSLLNLQNTESFLNFAKAKFNFQL